MDNIPFSFNKLSRRMPTMPVIRPCIVDDGKGGYKLIGPPARNPKAPRKIVKTTPKIDGSPLPLQDQSFGPPPEFLMMSEHPVNTELRVMVVPDNVDRKNLTEPMGFTIWTNTGRTIDSIGRIIATNTWFYHPILTHEVFREAMRKGLLFTKLELDGTFFSEAYLCPRNVSTNYNVPPLVLPNLKYFIMKVSLVVILKGANEEQRMEYLSYQSEHIQTVWARASWNVWYILKSITSHKLETFSMEDTIQWENLKLQSVKPVILLDCQLPLIDFIQRNGSCLKEIMLAPVLMSGWLANFKNSSPIPKLEKIRFSAKMIAEIDDRVPTKKKEVLLMDQVQRCMTPWRQLWKIQTHLTKLEWMCHKFNPWSFSRTDFIELCRMNPTLELILLTLHDDINLTKDWFGMNTLSKPEDFIFDCTWLQNLTSLNCLVIGCLPTDHNSDRFRLCNLGLLPKSLEILHFLGVQTSAEELERLTKLVRLKNLNILVPYVKHFNIVDEEEGTIEGVTLFVLQKFLRMRSLEQIAVSGFPRKTDEMLKVTPDSRTKLSGSNSTTTRTRTIVKEPTLLSEMVATASENSSNDENNNAESSEGTSWFGSCWETLGVCLPYQSNSNVVVPKKRKVEEPLSYSRKLGNLIKALSEVGHMEVKEIPRKRQVRILKVGTVIIPVENLAYV